MSERITLFVIRGAHILVGLDLKSSLGVLLPQRNKPLPHKLDSKKILEQTNEVIPTPNSINVDIYFLHFVEVVRFVQPAPGNIVVVV